jgi:DNA-binding GntR family transcriptional regulator
MADRAKEIADDIEERIEEQFSGFRIKLPTTRELSTMYKTSSRTISTALDKLKARGVIHTRPGKGIYVTPTPIKKR